MSEMMELSTFEDLLDLHGGDVARWPADVREPATALLAGSVAARSLRDAMVEVETVLRGSSVTVTGGVDTIAARATRQRQETPTRRFAMRAGWAAVATIVLVIGLSVGAHAPVEHDVSPARLMASALDFGGGGAADAE